MPQFYTVQQVAELLHAPVATVQYWIYDGRLPAFKPGRHPLVKAADLEAFIASSELGAKRAAAARRRKGRAA